MIKHLKPPENLRIHFVNKASLKIEKLSCFFVRFLPGRGVFCYTSCTTSCLK
ncbi:hypothetical protein NBO_66g0019 [Nosema bombycis CQ1]|uniref:Uncharacterized protein n=1 Tax=Nosema bombycis (strain CQ1 / CVCC 102059) TaxID=578461 RepID=R0MHE0_NOSB1|nr:hypothetical protein NBO_66g0019 [Nosema bombycis CQ1]|eukprot:EOB13560.1 hypothetical protein NBO_66g0019 [Nosema bombycis CQ1]